VVADRLAGSSLRAALVFDGAQLDGLLTPDDIRYAIRWGERSRLLAWPRRGPPPGIGVHCLGPGLPACRRASNPALRPAHQRRHVVTGPRA
jgi:hypothetical protein